MNPTKYFLGSGSAELDRLRLQAKIYEEHTRWLLDRIPIQPGWRALHVACGPVGIVPLLAERVAPTGEVIGLDSDERMVESARALVMDQHLTNVQVLLGDARQTGLPGSSFDLVHERLLLVNVPDPESVLAEMTRLTRPGGFIAVQEVDTVSWLCEPPHPAWDRLLDAWKIIGIELGKDQFIGRRLAALLKDAGLVDVGVHAHALVYRDSHPYKMHLLWFMNLGRDKILERDCFLLRSCPNLWIGYECTSNSRALSFWLISYSRRGVDGRREPPPSWIVVRVVRRQGTLHVETFLDRTDLRAIGGMSIVCRSIRWRGVLNDER